MYSFAYIPLRNAARFVTLAHLPRNAHSPLTRGFCISSCAVAEISAFCIMPHLPGSRNPRSCARSRAVTESSAFCNIGPPLPLSRRNSRSCVTMPHDQPCYARSGGVGAGVRKSSAFCNRPFRGTGLLSSRPVSVLLLLGCNVIALPSFPI